MIQYVYKTEIIQYVLLIIFFLSMLSMKQYLVNKDKETLSIKNWLKWSNGGYKIISKHNKIRGNNLCWSRSKVRKIFHSLNLYIMYLCIAWNKLDLILTMVFSYRICWKFQIWPIDFILSVMLNKNIKMFP